MRKVRVALLLGAQVSVGFATSNTNDAFVDLGVGGVDSSVQGAQYLRGVEESLLSKLGSDAYYVEIELIREIKQRHESWLQRLEPGERGQSNESQ